MLWSGGEYSVGPREELAEFLLETGLYISFWDAGEYVRVQGLKGCVRHPNKMGQTVL